MENLNDLEELRKEYISTKENLAGERITDADAIDRSIRLGMNELKLAKRKWLLLSIGGMMAFAIVILFAYKIVHSTAMLVSTSIIILLYAVSAIVHNASRLNRLYGKDNTTFINNIRKLLKLQYWFMRIYLVAFCFWAGFMVTLTLMKVDSMPARIAFPAVLVLFLFLNLFATIRMHNTVIGTYEGLMFDNEEIKETLTSTYYSEESIRERGRKSAKRKYRVCISMILIMSALLVWQIIRVIKGVGIVTTLPVYAVFILLFIIIARANRKDM